MQKKIPQESEILTEKEC